MLKITLTFEMEEEQLREMFENNDIRFSKKKVKELKSEMDFSIDVVQSELEERFEEIVNEWVQNTFE